MPNADGMSDEPTNAGRSSGGSLFLQIDGLGYEHLQLALERGVMPFLRSLLHQGVYRVQRWPCGLPGDTPSVQCALFYGRDDLIPGFSWFRKRDGRWMSCVNPLHLREITAKLDRGGCPGLLAGGTSYANVFSGGARRTFLTTSALLSSGGIRLLDALRFLVLMAAARARLRSLFADATEEIVTDLADRLTALVLQRPRYRGGAFPLGRVGVNVVIRELAVAAARHDMAVGVPTTYINFGGYDLVGHNSGPRSWNALAALRGIDRAVARLFRAAASASRPYTVYVLSDHGMTPSIPAAVAFGEPLAAYVRRLVRDNGGPSTAPRPYLFQRLPYLNSLKLCLEDLETHLGPRLARVAVALHQRLGGAPDGATFPPVVTTVTGSLAHVYLLERPDQLDLDEVSALQPDLVPGLLRHPGVGLVVGQRGGDVVALGPRGSTTLTSPRRVHGEDPLAPFGDPELIAEQLRRLAAVGERGDLVVLGAYRGGQAVALEAQLGCHGGLGGDQAYPFLLHPSTVPVDLGDVRGARDLYPLLAALVRGTALRPSPGPVARSAPPPASSSAKVLV